MNIRRSTTHQRYPVRYDRAAAAFADVVSEHSASQGMPQAALIGMRTR